MGLAGNGLERAERFHEIVEDDTTTALMSFWGGLNTASMIDYVDNESINIIKKPVVGYSDTTSLLLSLYQSGSERCYYGPAFISFAKEHYSPYTGSSLALALKGSAFDYIHPVTIAGDSRPQLKVLQAGTAHGRAIAGNLDTLLSIVGTSHMPDCEGAVLFIEEAEYVDDRRFFRHMTQLMQTGISKKIAALCVGSFTEKSNIDQPTLDVILTATVPRSIPIVTNVAIGHTDPISTIPIGRKVTVELDSSSHRISFAAANSV